MNQQFIVTNPILPNKLLNCVDYFYPQLPDREKVTAHFTGIPLLKHCVDPNADDISIIVIITKDKNEYYKENYRMFLDELKVISEEKGVDLESKIQTIEFDFVENTKKHIDLFTRLCNSYLENAELYMDLTFGSKATSIDLFSTLAYAEKVKGCDLKEVVYGKGVPGEPTEIYNLITLYRMANLINTMSFIPGADIDQMLKEFKDK